MKDTESRKEFEARLTSLGQAYVAGLPRRFTDLRTALSQRNDEGVSEDGLQQLQRLAHSLAGSAKTFGLMQLGRRARALEAAVVDGIDDSRYLAKLIAECERADRTPRAVASVATGVRQVGHSVAEPPEVLVIEIDRVAGKELASQLNYFGFCARALDSRQAFVDAVRETTRPSAVIADVAYIAGGNDGSMGIRALRASGALPAPVVFLSRRDEFRTRLAAVQAGGAAYFTKPFDIVPLVDRLDALTGQERDTPYRVLVVDDEPEAGRYHAAVLSSGGFVTTVCDTPSAVPSVLSEFRPDLVLLDLHMPECSGADLAAVIRQIEGFLTMPIVFLSAEEDPQRRIGAMGRGGDDFISKPVIEEQLVAGIKMRVARARQIARLADRDGLTGLLKHTSIKEALSRELSNARRGDHACVFVLLDIDRFKNVNDTYGHLVGDRVIKSLARLLRNRLRESDWIGRYGGEEFAIVLPRCSVNAAQGLIEEIAHRFRAIRHHGAPGLDFSATFSAGAADYRLGDTVDAMIHAADSALYEAKRAGRDRVKVRPISG